MKGTGRQRENFGAETWDPGKWEVVKWPLGKNLKTTALCRIVRVDEKIMEHLANSLQGKRYLTRAVCLKRHGKTKLAEEGSGYISTRQGKYCGPGCH